MSDDDRAGWRTIPLTSDRVQGLVRGALELERTERGWLPHRLPARARRQVPDGQLAMAEAQPSGVRVALRTRATALELDVLPTKVAYLGVPPRPDGVHDLLVDGRLTARAVAGGGNVMTVDLATGATTTEPGPTATLRFSGLEPLEKDVELWLSHREITELVALRADADVAPLPDRGRPVWVHHGSSISHGSDAASPSTTWPAEAARRADVELVNLGFAGSALLDPFVARTVRDSPADLVSVKIGINLVNLDLVRLRAFGPAVHGFLDTVRDGHPDVPLAVVSPILCPVHEDTPGPSAPDTNPGRVRFVATGDPSDPTRLTLRRVREELERVVAARVGEDPALTYVDGRDLYGDADAVGLPLPDALHPDAATHRLMGERFADRWLRTAAGR